MKQELAKVKWKECILLREGMKRRQIKKPWQNDVRTFYAETFKIVKSNSM